MGVWNITIITVKSNNLQESFQPSGQVKTEHREAMENG